MFQRGSAESVCAGCLQAVVLWPPPAVVPGNRIGFRNYSSSPNWSCSCCSCARHFAARTMASSHSFTMAVCSRASISPLIWAYSSACGVSLPSSQNSTGQNRMTPTAVRVSSAFASLSILRPSSSSCVWRWYSSAWSSLQSSSLYCPGDKSAERISQECGPQETPTSGTITRSDKSLMAFKSRAIRGLRAV